MPDRNKLLLANAHVLTMDAKFQAFQPGAVVVEGGTILAVGPEAEIRAAHPDAEAVDCGGYILMPALINGHTHAPMALLRGLADDLRLDVWLLGYMMPVERAFVTPEFVRLGTLLACAEMIRSGIGTFADMYYFEEEIARATSEAGMRAVCAQTVLKFPAPDAGCFEDSLDRAREFIAAWKAHRLIVPAVAPHAPYTCTPEILRACADIAREFDVPLLTHIAETEQEVESARREWGMPVIPYLRKLGVLETKLTAAHCVHIDEGEMRSMQKVGAGVVHNPTSNLKLASGIAPVAKMLEIGLNVGIGTDGPASNNDQDMLEEIRLTALLAKGASGNPTAVPARTALTMATRMGAEALHIGHLTGSLEPGKRADLILLDLAGSHVTPKFERSPDTVYAQIVYSAKATDVHSLMVEGHWLMRERNLLTLNEPELLVRASETARRIDAFLRERESSILSKLVAIESATEEESHEVQVKVSLPDGYDMETQLAAAGLPVVRFRHYTEFDTYFQFGSPDEGRLRYREDQVLDAEGEAVNARYRLTLTGPAREREFAHAVLLSRSRFLAPATHSLRFYREYFEPHREVEVQKDRLRWLVSFQGMEFFINVDSLVKPVLPGKFLEVKSRTWSRKDAERKAELILDLLKALRLDEAQTLHEEYVELADEASAR